MTQHTLRLLTPDDHDAFYQLRLDALTHHPAAFATDAARWRDAPPSVTAGFLAESGQGEDGAVLGAFDDQRLVAMLGLSRTSRKPTTAHKATLWGLYVAPHARRCGIASALIDAAHTRALAWPGLRTLRAVVTLTPPTSPALDALLKAGFQQYGAEPMARCFDGAFYDQAFVWKPVVSDDAG